MKNIEKNFTENTICDKNNTERKMTMTTAFNVSARKAVRENRIPFEISGDTPNAETMEAMQEVKRMKVSPNLGKTYSNVDQMIEELLADV